MINWKARVLALSNSLRNDLLSKVIVQYKSFDSWLRARGYSEQQIQPLMVNSFYPSKKIVQTVGLEFFDYGTLSRLGFDNYPDDFVKDKLSRLLPIPQRSGSYHEYTVKGINFISKSQEDRIRILRINEVVDNPDTLLALLGSANDFRYTELELIGLYYFITFTKDITLYVKTILKPALALSTNGLELRAYLGVYTVSIKRWPEYWIKKLHTNEGSIFEVETVFGYIQDIVGQSHFDEVLDVLQLDNINVLCSPEEFVTVLDNYISNYSDQTVLKTDLNFNTFCDDWNLFTTSGSAPEYKIFDEDGKAHRVSKSVLPLVTTPFDLLALDNVNKVITKSEPKKFRIAYSVNTRDNFIESYFSDCFPMIFKRGNENHYTEMTTWEKLHLAGKLLETNKLLASSDIEKNDYIHNSVMDAYIISRIIPLSQINDYDAYLLYTLLDSTRVNKVVFPAFGNQNKKELSGLGGLFSGRRWTTFLNSFVNSFFNFVARSMVSSLKPLQVSKNVFGGDDSIQTVTAQNYGLLVYIYESCLLLTINPYKSYVSGYAGEFFRVLYIKGEKRLGYQNRLIHSLTSNNPASKQEIDLLSKFKAFDSVIQQFIRRGGLPTSNSLLLKLSKVYDIPESFLHIPVTSGGFGIGITDYSSKLKPGLPRFKTLHKEYKMNLSWYNRCMASLNSLGIPGVSESYLQDMKEGIRDFDLRKQSKLVYKTAILKWKQMVQIVKAVPKKEAFIRSVNLGSLAREEIIVRSATTIGTVVNNLANLFSTLRPVNYFSILNYRLFNDILNRGVFPKFKDKLNSLVLNGALTLSNRWVNSKTASVLKKLLNSKFDSNSKQVTSLPQDLSFYPKGIFCSVLSFAAVRSPIDYVLFSDIIQEDISVALRAVLPQLIAW